MTFVTHAAVIEMKRSKVSVAISLTPQLLNKANAQTFYKYCMVFRPTLFSYSSLMAICVTSGIITRT